MPEYLCFRDQICCSKAFITIVKAGLRKPLPILQPPQKAVDVSQPCCLKPPSLSPGGHHSNAGWRVGQGSRSPTPPSTSTPHCKVGASGSKTAVGDMSPLHLSWERAPGCSHPTTRLSQHQPKGVSLQSPQRRAGKMHEEGCGAGRSRRRGWAWAEESCLWAWRVPPRGGSVSYTGHR